MTSGRSRKKEAGQDEVRCECGHLLAKLTTEGVEMKCRKCKQVHLLRVSADSLVRPRHPALRAPRQAKPGSKHD